MRNKLKRQRNNRVKVLEHRSVVFQFLASSGDYNQHKSGTFCIYGALGGTRTHGLILRRDALYPTELQARLTGRYLT